MPDNPLTAEEAIAILDTQAAQCLEIKSVIEDVLRRSQLASHYRYKLEDIRLNLDIAARILRRD